MNELLKNLSLAVQQDIKSSIYSGEKIKAIRLYREAGGCDLATAKEVIESLTSDLKETNPYAFRNTNQFSGRVIAFITALLILWVAGTYVFFDNVTDDIKKWIESVLSMERDVIPESKVVAEDQHPAIEHTMRAPIPEYEEIYEPVIPEVIEWDLVKLYQMKLANDDYIAWKNKPGLPKGYQDYDEEHQIKYVRSAKAKDRMLPFNESAIAIPFTTDSPVSIDGVIHPSEWEDAIRLELEPTVKETVLYLLADPNWLYLAGDVPDDTTESGFDQFRFHFHIDIDPVIKNERIHVGRFKRRSLGGIRQTTVRWRGEIPENEDERWKKYAISDWRIYRMAKGASSLNPHRQFEAKINLKESGIHIGSPFPAFIEVETDPIYEDGKFRERLYSGMLGSQEQPVWFLIQ